MQINLDLTEPTANSVALDEVIFAQAITTIDFSITPAQSLANGVSCALLTAQGKVLAHTLVSENKAVLNTNTIQCYEFVRDLPTNSSHGAYLVLGSSTAPIAIVPVEVARNPLAEIAPPTERATVWPTTAEFDALIAQMQAVQTAVNADAQEVKNISETFPTAVENAKAEIVQQAEAVTADIMQAKADAEASASNAFQSASEASASANSANTSASNAETAYAGTAAIKTELQDALTEAAGVAERVIVVENELPEKLPYMSDWLTRFYDFKTGTITTQNIEVRVTLHRGWILYQQYAGTDLLINPHGSSQSVAKLGTIRFVLMEDSQTTIFSYSGETLYRATVVDSGDDLIFSREVVEAFPAAIADSTADYGIFHNSFVITQKGNILSADLETLIGTFPAQDSIWQILDEGETFRIYDKSTTKQARVTLDENGVPSITYNSYAHTASKDRLYPVLNSWTAAILYGGWYDFTTNANGGRYSDFFRQTTFFCPIVINKLGDTRNALLFSPSSVYALAKGIGTNESWEWKTKPDLLLEQARFFAPMYDVVSDQQPYAQFIHGRDLQGNVFMAYKIGYHAGTQPFPYVLFARKAVTE